MRIALLTNEYPPNIYGGAGVHAENLSRELALAEGGANQVDVFCFGDQLDASEGISVRGVNPGMRFGFENSGIEKIADVLTRDVAILGNLHRADIIHCHTWYTHFAGCLSKQFLGAPLVLTTHSLEPHRPWKEEQLGQAYHISSWLEKTAYQNADGVIAVSSAMKADVQRLYGVSPEKVKVIYNGIDTSVYVPSPDQRVLEKYGIDPRLPFVLFVGRITRQKGIIHLVEAIRHLRSGVQLVLCAGEPDTPELGNEVKLQVERARRESDNPIFWIPEFLTRREVMTLYSMASVFVCPSVYEPFGLINVEAMACATPVVGSAVGGIPEIIVDGETGLLVPLRPKAPNDPEPLEPELFARDLAGAVNQLLDKPELARQMGMRGRKRVEEVFSWKSVALQTLDFYRQLLTNL